MIGEPLGVEGHGLGTVAAAAALSKLGHGVRRLGDSIDPHGRGPVVVLNEKTLWMIGDLFGQYVLRNLCRVGVEVGFRKLRWSGATLESVPERSLSVAAGEVAAHLLQTLGARERAHTMTIRARGRAANRGAGVGELRAFVWSPALPRNYHMDWCATIASDQAWVSLAPDPKGRVVVQVFCPEGDSHLARDVAVDAMSIAGIAHLVEQLGDSLELDAAARLGSMWTGNCCAMGDESLALDPLAGDSVGHTIRAAVWFSSLLKVSDLSLADRSSRYCSRIRMAFAQHLSACKKYYSQIPNSSRWHRHTQKICVARRGILRDLEALPGS